MVNHVLRCSILYLKIQDSFSKRGAPANTSDSSLYRPEDILECITLPPPGFLDSLLVDAAKPAVSSRSTPVQCLRKPICHKTSLPPFPWSHYFGGPWRTNFDAGMLSTNRSTCQGRWASTSTPTRLVPSNVPPGLSSRLLTAAQILWEIASHSTKQNQISGMQWNDQVAQESFTSGHESPQVNVINREI
ncbi:hypothetical protein HHK36_033016 [Tetracentron sinense]|uniref:Uncharacterized protein n=1 Tax=Tetracentron sinense TaxID=13715 RepID=A0A835CZ21_TETSI|nr:hypothetical protein HHK36_033016 [Tetracentron sinense]